jgi:hypothetical protein
MIYVATCQGAQPLNDDITKALSERPRLEDLHYLLVRSPSLVTAEVHANMLPGYGCLILGSDFETLREMWKTYR